MDIGSTKVSSFNEESKAMTKASTPKPQDDPEQAKRFIDTAKELGADEEQGAMDRALKRVNPKTPFRAPERE